MQFILITALLVTLGVLYVYIVKTKEINLYRRFFGCLTLDFFFVTLKEYLLDKYPFVVDLYRFTEGIGFKNIDTDERLEQYITTSLFHDVPVRLNNTYYLPVKYKSPYCWQIKKCFNRECYLWGKKQICWSKKFNEKCPSCEAFNLIGALKIKGNYLNYLRISILLKKLGPIIQGISYYTVIHNKAFRDGLTGLLNKNTFMQEADRALDNNKVRLKPCTIVMCDIDHFKSYNDTFGHQAGDELLKLYGSVLVQSVRKENDLAGRYGGEEFILFLDCNKKQALEIVKKLKREISRQCSLRRTVTASFGVASYPEDAYTLTDLISLADQALYNSKRSGRNRISFYVKNTILVYNDAECVESIP